MHSGRAPIVDLSNNPDAVRVFGDGINGCLDSFGEALSPLTELMAW